jgi:hypothetical protein
MRELHLGVHQPSLLVPLFRLPLTD